MNIQIIYNQIMNTWLLTSGMEIPQNLYLIITEQ